MFKWIGGLLERICAVICATLFVQIPLFVSQYTNQLIGHEAELRFHVEALNRTAKLSGKNLDIYIQKFLHNSDADISNIGELMQAMVLRLQDLTNALTALQESTPMTRPFVFLAHINTDILRSTFKHFSFGFPFTIEGGVYALVGIVFGYCLCSGVKRCFRFLTAVPPEQKTT